MTRRAARAALVLGALLAAATAARAHVGSPHIYLEDKAGPYPITVACEMPKAIPGEAVVQVLLEDLKDGEEVRVAVREIPPAGDRRAPDWTPARASAADPRFFSAPLPLMVYGLWHAEVRVSGARGDGMIRFPVTAKVPAPRGMGLLLSGGLLALCILLVAALWYILVGLGRDAARARDDVPPEPRDRRRGVVWATVGCVLFVSFVSFIGEFWWRFHESRSVRTGPALSAQLEVVDGPLEAGHRTALRMTVFDARGRRITNVRSDHDKMMHLAIAKLPKATFFLHMHPTMVEDGVFDFHFTPPEPGTYAYFADVLFGSGEGDTATGTIDVKGGTDTKTFTFDDPDDSYAFGPPMDPAKADNARWDVGNGMTMAWVSGGPRNLRPLRVQKMTFELRDPSGKPVASFQRYMGMAGHMLTMREDAKIFAHVHPTGTIAGRMGSMPGGHDMAMMMNAPIQGSRAAFPFAYPQPGFYRLWAQMKYEGRIYTGIFDVKVK